MIFQQYQLIVMFQASLSKLQQISNMSECSKNVVFCHFSSGGLSCYWFSGKCKYGNTPENSSFMNQKDGNPHFLHDLRAFYHKNENIS